MHNWYANTHLKTFRLYIFNIKIKKLKYHASNSEDMESGLIIRLMKNSYQTYATLQKKCQFSKFDQQHIR